MFVSLHKEFRMSLKVKYSALQKAGQQGMFFFSVAAKMYYFILYGIDKSGTPTYCPSTSCRSFEQIILQTVPLCLMPLILKFEVFTSRKFKGFFFPFLKKMKEILELAFTENKVNRETYYNLVFNFIFLNLFIFFPQREMGY